MTILNYDYPMKKQLLELINHEAIIVQLIEVLTKSGDRKEVRLLNIEKRLTKNRRICLQKALEHKEIAVSWTNSLLHTNKNKLA
ncbi:hypothetical protein ACSVDA_23965 [Cytobacillus sp. Hm23]